MIAFGRKPKTNPVAYLIAESNTEQSPESSCRVRTRGAQARTAQRTSRRILMCAVMFGFVFLGLVGRLAIIANGEVPTTNGYKHADADAVIRVDITDRNGALLATNIPMRSLEVAGREVWSPEETASKLASVLPDLDVIALSQKLAAGHYVEVNTDIDPGTQREIFDLGLPGVRFSSRMKRIYPQADLAAHLVGHVEAGRGGVMGLEKFANGREATVRASIDIRIQQILETELQASMKKFEAIAAWGAVMDVDTGELIAIVSLPDFDPNAPGAVPADWRRNRATYDRYELGSAFKAITAAAAIDAGVAEEFSGYDARKPYRVANRTITDFHGERRVLTLSEVVQHSSNIGMVQVAEALGSADQKAYLEALGLFAPLQMELAENRNTELPYQWGPVETATISYGHGISVTPLHLLAAFNAVINGGRYVVPKFISAPETDAASVFSPTTSSIMRRILRRVITDGTASFADVDGYFPIGKTATADKPSKSGGYDRSTRIASFVGAFPGYRPRYTVIVSLDEPKAIPQTHGFATAGWNTAPTFSRIVKRAAPILGVAPVNEAYAINAFMEPAEERREARIVRKQEERNQ